MPLRPGRNIRPKSLESEGESKRPVNQDAFKETVRDHNPIKEVIGESVKLNWSGQGYMALCPFHDDTDPSLSVDPQKGVFHCFGCDAGGDVFSFVMKRDGLSFPEVLGLLAKRAGLERPDFSPQQRERFELRRKFEKILTQAADYYHSVLPDPIRKRYYHRQYGFTDETIDTFKLGWANGKLTAHLIANGIAPDDIVKCGLAVKVRGELVDFFQGRLVFPYWKSGCCVYLIGRKTMCTPNEVWEKAKYKKLKTNDLIQNDHFYNEDATRGTTQLQITEGITDCIAAYQSGISCISPATTRIRRADHPRLLHLTRNISQIFICNDNEENRSGEKGAIQTAEVLEDAGKDVLI